jgi:adenosylmethionine-8-amino-7-oxononanoate aminotransferase
VGAVTLAADDRRHLWHPFTQQRGWEHEDAPVIERADGVWLFDTYGNRYIDGISSLWCNVHGHRHPAIDIAVKDQLDRVAHTTMLGLTHPAAIELAGRLVEIAPDGLTRVFYSDSGSTATEIALKMTFQYWAQRGGEDARRTRFVSLREAYHGDTIGSVSLGGIDLFHSTYRPLLFDSLKAEPGDAADMERLLSEHAGEVAAVIVEPLVQGAAGMIVHPEGYLRDVRALCDRYGALLVCDEVATGFGRTGRMFACEHEGVSPDLLCVAKGLTGGYMPLAATLATERIYEGFLGEFEDFRTFFHGHTYTGNPLACAAALATLRLFEQERTLEMLQPKIELLGRLLDPIAAQPAVAEVRRRGFMCGIELAGFPVAARMGHRVTLEARRRGVVVRPLGDVVVLMPPLAIGARELRRLVEVVGESIAAVTAREAPAALAA